MRGRSYKRKPEKRDIVLMPVVVSLRKLSEGSYSSYSSTLSIKSEVKTENEVNNSSLNMAKLSEINNSLKESSSTLINGDSQTNGTCGDDESVCDDKSLCQDPGWQKDVSDVLSSLLKDGGTCASEWGGDIEDGIIELPDLEKGEDRFYTSKPRISSDRANNYLGSSKEKSKSLDTSFLSSKANDSGQTVEDSGSDATITEMTDNAELETVASPTSQEPSSPQKLKLPKSSPTDISELSAPELLQPEYSDKLKIHKVSPLSIYAEVKDGEIQSVSCKRFKRRRKRQSEERLSKIADARRRRSVCSLPEGDLSADTIVRDVLDDLVFRTYVKTDGIDLEGDWSPEDSFVKNLVSDFCKENHYDHSDFNDLNSVLNFGSNIVSEKDIIEGSIQRKGYKRKFSQDEDTSFKKKRRRKLKNGEVVKKFFTRSAARRLQYITDKNGDTIVVEELPPETETVDNEDDEKATVVDVKEIVKLPEVKAAENAEGGEVNEEDCKVRDNEEIVEMKTDSIKPFEEAAQPSVKESVTPVAKVSENEAAVETETKSSLQENKIEKKALLQEEKADKKPSLEERKAVKEVIEILDDHKSCTASKVRYKQRKIKCAGEEPKNPPEGDVPLDLRIKEGTDNLFSSTKSKTPIQMVHPQVNTSVMPKKLWCARRNMDCFISNETVSLVNGTSTTETKQSPSPTAPKVGNPVIEPKKLQESEAESILRTLLLEASDAAAADVACDTKKSPIGNGIASPSVPRVPSAVDKENAKGSTEHKEALNRIKDAIRRSTPRLKSSPVPSPVSSPKAKPFEIDSIVDMEKLQDPRLIKEEIRKLKNEIVHLEMIAEQKEKERVAIMCFKNCKEEILKQIENSQLSTLLQKSESCNSEPAKTQSAVQSRLSLQALYNFAKNKMFDTLKQNAVYQSNHRETCMVRPIVAHENRKSPMSTESLPSVEALVAKATENYGVTFDHLSEEKAQSLSRRTLEHNRRIAELQHSAYQCCADASWTSGVYGYGPSPVLCNNSFHTSSLGMQMSKTSTDQEVQQAQSKPCWKYSNMSGYGNKERLDSKISEEQTKAEGSKDSKNLYHQPTNVPPASWTERSYSKHMNGSVTVASKPSEVPSSSSRHAPAVSTPSATYVGNNVGRYAGINLSQSYYPSHTYGLPVSYWSPNGYSSHHLSRRQQQANENGDVSSGVRTEKQRWMDRPCPVTYHSSYVSPRGNSTSPC